MAKVGFTRIPRMTFICIDQAPLVLLSSLLCLMKVSLDPYVPHDPERLGVCNARVDWSKKFLSCSEVEASFRRRG